MPQPAGDDQTFLQDVARWFRKSEYRYLEISDELAVSVAVRLEKIAQGAK